MAGAGAHAFTHVTGGGLAGNLARVLPAATVACVDRATWAPGPVFELIARTGAVPLAQMELTFNLGVGMVAVVPAHRVADALAVADGRGVPAWPLGDVREAHTDQTSPDRSGQVVLAASYTGSAGFWA